MFQQRHLCALAACLADCRRELEYAPEYLDAFKHIEENMRALMARHNSKFKSELWQKAVYGNDRTR